MTLSSTTWMLCAVALVCVPIIGAVGAPSPSRTHTVSIEAMQFQPEVLTVSSGDTIVWINKDPVPHTATSADGGFDSKDIPAGKSWTHLVRKKGQFAYICTFHPTMKAMLRVE